MRRADASRPACAQQRLGRDRSARRGDAARRAGRPRRGGADRPRHLAGHAEAAPGRPACLGWPCSPAWNCPAAWTAAACTCWPTCSTRTSRTWPPNSPDPRRPRAARPRHGRPAAGLGVDVTWDHVAALAGGRGRPPAHRPGHGGQRSHRHPPCRRSPGTGSATAAGPTSAGTRSTRSAPSAWSGRRAASPSWPILAPTGTLLSRTSRSPGWPPQDWPALRCSIPTSRMPNGPGSSPWLTISAWRPPAAATTTAAHRLPYRLRDHLRRGLSGPALPRTREPCLGCLDGRRLPRPA